MIEPEFLLDADLCIDLLAGRSARAVERVASCHDGQLVTSAIVYAEVMIGAARLHSIAQAQAFFAKVAPLPLAIAAGDAYARLPFKRGSFDRLIAAHALAVDLTLVTSNARHFADIPGLRVENWTL